MTRRKLHRKSNFIIEQELAVSRALSALCGGSGVGQAPELPQRAQNAIFLPIFPKIRSQDPKIPKLEVIKFENSKEDKIYELTNLRVNELRNEKDEAGSKKQEVGKINYRKTTRSFLTFASIVLILTSVVGFVFTFGPILQAEINYRIKKQEVGSKKISSKLKVQSSKKNKPLILPITAAKEVGEINFPATSSIVIPKINAQAEFFVNTDASNYDEYTGVLQKGVAHAKGTALPGEVGNAYFFAHSAGNLFDVARFNAVFYLISNLEKGDSIYVSFGNQKFKYTVYDKKEVEPNDVEYLNNRKDNGRMLTLQTCTPPGTDWRRLLIFAKIEE